MFKPLIAGITALALTLSTTAPVQARGLSEDDIGKIIFGLAALAAVGAIVESNKDSRPRTVTPTHRPVPEVERPQRQRQIDRRVLPRNCLRGYETRFGTHRMFGARCLRNSYAFAEHLPRRCAVRIFTDAGPRRGFDPACLRNQGYIARR